MSLDETAGHEVDASAPAGPELRAHPGFLRRHRLKLVLAALVVVPALLFAAYTAATLALSYSRGDRVGYLQKLSKKGWICPTWEGELAMATMPGVVPEIFSFSIRDETIAAKVNELQGRRVALEYAQKKGVPTKCFGESEYFVTGVRPLAGP
jgi:hypothetical protein